MDPLAALSSAPWWGLAVGIVALLGSLWSGCVTAASLVCRVLESRGADGRYLWDYPRLRAIAHAVALTPRSLTDPPVMP